MLAMLARAAFAALLLAVLAADAQAQGAPATAPRIDPAVPPTAKQLIRAVMRMQGMPLSRGAHCAGVGTERRDRDIGDYLSGFLAELTDGGRNWIETGAERATDPRSRAAVWRARVVIRRVHEEDRIGWGVAFTLRARDHSLVPGSLVCTGAG